MFTLDINGKLLRQQLHELKVKMHTLRNDLVSVRRLQHSLQENFKSQLNDANKKIEVNSQVTAPPQIYERSSVVVESNPTYAPYGNALCAMPKCRK